MLRSLLLAALVLLHWGCSSTPSPSQAPAPQPVAAEPRPPELTHLPDVPLGPGDEFEVLVYRSPELTRKIRIPRSGLIFYPLAGEIQAKGMTANELRRHITTALEPYIVDPQVSIDMVAHRSQKIVVLGEVRAPGIFTLDSPMTVLEAVGMAGGFATTADKDHVILAHQRPGNLSSEVVALDSLENDLPSNPSLTAGDVVYVPPEAIVNWARYARNVENILRPFIFFEQGILLGYDISLAIQGKRTGTSTIILPGGDTPAP